MVTVLIGQLEWKTPRKVQTTTTTNIISIKHGTNHLFVLNTYYSMVIYRSSINVINGVMRNALFYSVLFLLNKQSLKKKTRSRCVTHPTCVGDFLSWRLGLTLRKPLAARDEPPASPFLRPSVTLLDRQESEDEVINIRIPHFSLL